MRNVHVLCSSCPPPASRGQLSIYTIYQQPEIHVLLIVKFNWPTFLEIIRLGHVIKWGPLGIAAADFFRLNALPVTQAVTSKHCRKNVSPCVKVIHSFISGMHHYECIAPNVDINLQSGWFWATSIASFRERFIDFRSCWVVFIHIVQGRPGGLLQFSKGEAVKICLASDSSGIRTVWPNRERRRAWVRCFIVSPCVCLQWLSVGEHG